MDKANTMDITKPGGQVAVRSELAGENLAGESREFAAGRRRVPVSLFAGVIITNVFAPQILIGQMAEAFGLREASGGLIAMIPLLGYAMSLFFLVPLFDLIET